MPAFTVPTGWEYYDSSKDQVTFARVGHESATPNLVIIKRSVVPATATTPSTSKYNVKYVLGVDQDTAGATASVNRPNALIDFNVRHVDTTDTALTAEDTEVDEILDELGALIITAEFKENVKASLLIPTN